jgi:acyl-coenzyme A thioesterase PaaI-like protein
LKSGDDVMGALLNHVRSRLGDRADAYAFPPPVFEAMGGELLEFSPHTGTLTARFPVRESYLNPYGTMQGGMLAAAVDNTLGPLSVLVAPPNVTRRLELTYSRPATLEMHHIIVVARLLERRDRWLEFKAEVRSCEGHRLARAKATHWIIDAMGDWEDERG